MKYTEGNLGRTFILRLEDGDKLPDTIENFAKDHSIASGFVLFLGGAKKNSKIISGPKRSNDISPIPIVKKLSGVSESNGVGTIFTNSSGDPILHMHASFGRKKKTVTGCVRKDVDIWLVGEIIIIEIINCNPKRLKDVKSGFELLSV